MKSRYALASCVHQNISCGLKSCVDLSEINATVAHSRTRLTFALARYTRASSPLPLLHQPFKCLHDDEQSPSEHAR